MKQFLLNTIKFIFIFSLAACGLYVDPDTPKFPSGMYQIHVAAHAVGTTHQGYDAASRCAYQRIYSDALRSGYVLISSNGFLRASTNEEERLMLDFFERSNSFHGNDCSATFSASRQQFSNFLDARTSFRIPPMYPRAQNPRRIRLGVGDPVPTNEYIQRVAAAAPTNNARSAGSLQQAETLMRAGSTLMGGTLAPSSGGTCFKQSERISGFNKLCEYSCVTGNTVRTITSTQLCPLTIRN